MCVDVILQLGRGFEGVRTIGTWNGRVEESPKEAKENRFYICVAVQWNEISNVVGEDTFFRYNNC